MNITRLIALAALTVTAAYADFSYTSVSKTPAGETTSKHYFKGQKMITDSGNSVTILDLDAQTMTTINKAAKTYTVRTFAEMAAMANGATSGVSVEAKKTGQRQKINGFDAEEMVMDMTMDTSQMRGGAGGRGMQMQMEMHMWVAPDVPGAEELRAFYMKNADRMPWGALSQGNSGMANAMKTMASMKGVTVRTEMKMGGMGGAAAPSMSPQQQQAQMDAARARMEEMAKQGGAQGAAAQQALARMGAMSGGGGGGSSVVSDSKDFSTAPVSDSVYAIPAGFTKAEK